MTKTLSYSEIAKALDAWAGYHDRFNKNVRRVVETLTDAWGRVPDDGMIRLSAKAISDFHGGNPRVCKRASALLDSLGQ